VALVELARVAEISVVAEVLPVLLDEAVEVLPVVEPVEGAHPPF